MTLLLLIAIFNIHFIREILTLLSITAPLNSLAFQKKGTTPNIILYSELGRYPIDIFVKARMIGFWQRIINGKQDKIAFKLYKILLSIHERNLFHSKWLLTVEKCLNVWQSQENVPLNIAKSVKLKLMDNFKHEWLKLVFNSSKCLNYRIFKTELVF